MDTAISAETGQLVKEFVRLIQETGGATLIPYETRDSAVTELFTKYHEAIVQNSWHEVAAAGTGEGGDVSLLSSMIVGAVASAPTPSYPFAETFAARRLLAAIGSEDLAFTPALPVAAAGYGLSKGESQKSLIVAYADQAESIIYLKPEQDGYRVFLLSQSDITLQRLNQPDTTRPLFHVMPKSTGMDLGKLNSVKAQSLHAELVLFEAAEMLGCGDALLTATITHISNRIQFGKPLSAFQALSHRTVDLYVHLETLRSLVVYAGWVADSFPEQLTDFASMAKAYASEHCWMMANEAIQMHGGMGFTWEMGLQHPAARIISRAITTPTGDECYEQVGSSSIHAGKMLGLIE